MNKNEALLLVEGVDSSGKDTVASGLLGSVFLGEARKGRMSETPNPFDKAMIPLITSTDPLERLEAKARLAYLGTWWDVMSMEARGVTVPLLQISLSAIRSYAFYKAIGGELGKQAEGYKSLAARYPQPDLAVTLYASADERRKRLELKEKVTPFDVLAFSHPQLINDVAENIITFSKDVFGAEIVDTSELSIEEVSAEVSRLAVLAGIARK